VIRALRLVHWRCFPELIWEPDPRVNLVIAPNDAGKTTLRSAIEFLISGRAYGFTDERGAGAESLIRAGEKQAVVEALLAVGEAEPFGVRRTLHASSAPTKIEVQGVSGGPEVQARVLAERLGHGPDVASLALNTGRFLERPPAEQQALVLRLGGVAYTSEQIAGALSSQRAVRALAAVGCETAAGGAEVLATIEKRAREGRHIAKRDRDAIADALRALPAAQPLSAEGRAAAERRIAEAQAERDQLQRDSGAAYVRASAAKRLPAQAERLQLEIAELERKIEAWSAGPTLEAARQAEAAAWAEATRLAEAWQTREAEQAAAAADLSRWQAALELLTQGEGEDGTCPFCPGISCGIQVSAALAAVQSGFAAAQQRSLQARAAAAAAGEAAGKALAAAEKAREARSIADGRQAGIEAARPQLASKRRALEEVRAEQGTVAAAAAAAGDVEREERIAELDRQMQADRDLLAASKRAEEAAARRAELEERLRAAEERVRDLEDLCAEFGPDGIRSRLVEPVLSGFLADANFVLGTAAGGAFLHAAADGGIEVESPAWPGRLRPPALSRSMRLRVGVALQYALCRAACWPLLLVDDADMLDARNRNSTVAILQEAADEGRQVIVLAAQPAAELPKDPGIEGLAMWTIADGQFVRLGPASGKGAA
jgi:hypothetical protein